VVLEIRGGIIHLRVCVSDKFEEAFDSTRELCCPLGIGLALVDLDLCIEAIAMVERTEEFVPDGDAIRWVKVVEEISGTGAAVTSCCAECPINHPLVPSTVIVRAEKPGANHVGKAGLV
jgi:hypothetical protein